MARMRSIADRAEQVLGSAVVATSPVAGGDICISTRLRLTDGRSALMKTRPNAPAGFFEAEARGLRWLAEPGAVPVADVLAVAPDCLILGWVEPMRPSAEHAVALGHGLAALHRAGAETFGNAEPGFIGPLPLAAGTTDSWPDFFAAKRVLPYLKLAADRGHIGDDDRRAVEDAVARIDELAGPGEPPARLHGDLWSGNVVWADGPSAVLIDPAAHGGHRESDLAMLALFGITDLPRLMDAYAEVHPLADGWEERQPLHRLFPLLVHAALFGGRYGASAGDAARRLL